MLLAPCLQCVFIVLSTKVHIATFSPHIVVAVGFNHNLVATGVDV